MRVGFSVFHKRQLICGRIEKEASKFHHLSNKHRHFERVAMLHIDALSDDEIVTPPEQTGPGACVQRPAKRRKPGEVALVARDSDLRRDLRSIVDSKCFCSKRSRQTHRPSCFEPFREPAQFKSLFDLRKILKQKNKEDSDKQAP